MPRANGIELYVTAGGAVWAPASGPMGDATALGVATRLRCGRAGWLRTPVKVGHLVTAVVMGDSGAVVSGDAVC